MKVYEMVGDGLLELDPEEWSDEVAEVAVEAPAVVVVEETVSV